MQPALIDTCSAGGPRLLRQPPGIEIRKWVVGAASVAEGYTCKATPAVPSSPHSRRTHTCYPVSRTPSKERPHSLACPHKATSTQPIRHGTYCLFCCVVYSWCFTMAGPCPESELQAPFCILLGFQPPLLRTEWLCSISAHWFLLWATDMRRGGGKRPQSLFDV